MLSLHLISVLCIFITIQLVASSHSFANTSVKEYSQENLHVFTGIGLGPKKIKGDVFIMFYASWCPHCQKLMPTWIELKNSDPDLNSQIVAVHCPDNHDLCEAFSVQGYPTLILFSRQSYKLCVFEGQRNLQAIQEFWKRKCEGETRKDIPYRVKEGSYNEDEEDDEENEEPISEIKESLDGIPANQPSEIEDEEEKEIEENEKKKTVMNFKRQKNKAYQEKIMKFKDYFKKLGPLVVISFLLLCIFSITFVCNKCCFPQHEEVYTTKRREKKAIQMTSI